jgi:hypothetical protein
MKPLGRKPSIFVFSPNCRRMSGAHAILERE